MLKMWILALSPSLPPNQKAAFELDAVRLWSTVFFFYIYLVFILDNLILGANLQVH